MKQRVTFTLDEEVVEIYKQMAWEARQPLSTLVNEWLATTAPAMQHLHQQVLELKTAPGKVLNDLKLFQEKTEEQLADLRRVIDKAQEQTEARTARSDAPHCPEQPDATRAADSPPSNTGLNPPLTPEKRTKRGQK